jgi:serine protease Do
MLQNPSTRNEPRRLRIAATLLALLALPVISPARSTGGYSELVRQVAPSVVTVLVEEKREGAAQRAVERAAARSNERDQVTDLIHRLLAGPGANAEHRGDAALGSGFIIRADGLIVTNRHVVVGARSILVKLPSGQQLPAKVVGIDAATDLALLKIGASRLPVLRLGSSANVSVGDEAIAIGNPFGLGQTVTAGIVSARGRTMEDDPYIDFLQTDAPINFGNSGGPLLSADGTVVGVTSAIFSPSGGSVGLGFAIPAEIVSAVVAELEAHGRVQRGFLGISAQPMTAAIARAFGLKTITGALVTDVDPHGPSSESLKVGDVLLNIGGSPVTFERLARVAGRLKPGSVVQARVLRDDADQTLALLIGQLPDPPEDPTFSGDQDTWVPGLELGAAKSTAAIRSAIKAEGESSGLIVTQLRPAGSGALAGLRVGDLLTHAGTKHLEEVSDIASVSKPTPKQPLLLRVIRDGAPSFIAVTGTEER